MIHAANEFIKNDHKPATFHTNLFFGDAKVLLGELQLRYFELDIETFPTFALFVDTKIQQTKKVSYPIISVFISTISSFEYDERDKSKK